MLFHNYFSNQLEVFVEILQKYWSNICTICATYKTLQTLNFRWKNMDEIKQGCCSDSGYVMNHWKCSKQPIIQYYCTTLCIRLNTNFLLTRLASAGLHRICTNSKEKELVLSHIACSILVTNVCLFTNVCILTYSVCTVCRSFYRDLNSTLQCFVCAFVSHNSARAHPVLWIFFS